MSDANPDFHNDAPPGLASNDEQGVVYCHQCDWTKQCASMEQIEFELTRHYAAAHGRKVLYRVDNENGKREEIPQ